MKEEPKEKQRLYWILILNPTEDKMIQLENILNPVVIKGLRHFGFWLFSCVFTLKEIEDQLEKSTSDDFYFILNDITDNATKDKLTGFVPSQHSLGKFSKEVFENFRESTKTLETTGNAKDIDVILKQLKEKGRESLSPEQLKLLNNPGSWTA